MVLVLGESADGKLLAAGRSESVCIWRLDKNASSYKAQAAKEVPRNLRLRCRKTMRRAVFDMAETLAAQGPKGIEQLVKKLRENGPVMWKYAALALSSQSGARCRAARCSDRGIAGWQERGSPIGHGSAGRDWGQSQAWVPAVILAAADTSDFKGSISSGGFSNKAGGLSKPSRQSIRCHAPPRGKIASRPSRSRGEWPGNTIVQRFAHSPPTWTGREAWAATAQGFGTPHMPMHLS